MTAQPTEPDEPLAQVPARELGRLRALARIASQQELAEADEAARDRGTGRAGGVRADG
jgi:hypothetical protein